MGLKNVELLGGTITPDDVKMVIYKAAEQCFCTDEMKQDYDVDLHSVACLPCASRWVLNNLSAVVDLVKTEFN